MKTVEKEEKEYDPDEIARQQRIKNMPILEQCYNLMDFEAVARTVMKKTAWAYYSSGADDEIVCIMKRKLSRQDMAGQRNTDTPADNERKSYCLPQDLVPAPDPC